MEVNDEEYKLRQLISNYVLDDNNKIFIGNLKKSYQVLQELSDEEYDMLKDDIFKNNKKGFDILFELVNNYDNKINILHAILNKNNEDIFPSIEDLKRGSNLYEVILSDKFVKLFNSKEEAENFLKNEKTGLVSKTYKDENDKSVGKGELCIFTLFKNTKTGKKNKEKVNGDIQMGGKNIEVKFSATSSSCGGRLLGSNLRLKSPLEMVAFLSGELISNGVNHDKLENLRIGGYTILKDTIEYIENNSKLNKKQIFIILAKMYLYQFTELYKSNIICKCFNEFIDNIDLNELTDIKIGEILIRIHGCLALIEYHESDNWDMLLVANASNGDYYIINGYECSLDNFKENLNLLYNNCNFTFKDGPLNTKGAMPRNYVSTIYVKKRK